MASGHASGRGISEARMEGAPSKPSSRIAASSQREGRHSMRASGAPRRTMVAGTVGTLPGRQLADSLDEPVEFDIAGNLVAHEPVPELIVLAVQQP